MKTPASCQNQRVKLISLKENNMYKLILYMGLLLMSAFVWASPNCFVAQENNKIIQAIGACEVQHSPRCSFNIPLSLIAFEEGLLLDARHPKKAFNQNYVDGRAVCEQATDPRHWIKNSCVWYSQWITESLGMKVFQEYINAFDYGNTDLSGDLGKHNGLTRAWLNSSLKISPKEQIVFLQKMLNRQFSLKPEAYEHTKQILFVEKLPNGWTLYGKTGTGTPPNKDAIRSGWFVGWIEKDKQSIIFAQYIEVGIDETPNGMYAGPYAKELAKEQLMQFLKTKGR